MNHYADEGNAAELDFGREFVFSESDKSLSCLTNDEALIILEKLKDINTHE
jgi:hypothetical protein